MFDSPEVGEVLEHVLTRLKNQIDDVVQQQYDVCMKKGFELKKYYIWYLYYKNPKGQLVFRYPICRVTRPSPYQDEDMILFSVTNYDNVQFEYCIPKKEHFNYIMAHPHEFDKDYVIMLRNYRDDKLEKAEDYVFKGQLV